MIICSGPYILIDFNELVEQPPKATRVGRAADHQEEVTRSQIDRQTLKIGFDIVLVNADQGLSVKLSTSRAPLT